MTATRKKAVYGLYIIAAGCFFLYYLFPSEALRRFIASELKHAHPELDITIDRIYPVLPPGLRMRAVALLYHGRPLIDAEEFTLTPVIASLFGARPEIAFKGRSGQGIFQGAVEKQTTDQTSHWLVNADFSEIHLEAVPVWQHLSGYALSGRLSGRLTFQQTGAAGIGAASLSIRDGAIEFSPPLLDLKQFDFDTLELAIALSPRRLRIERCTLKGRQLEGNMSGSIGLASAYLQNGLRLAGILRPHPVLLADLKRRLPDTLWPQIRNSPEGFAFNIDGTVGNPRISLR